MDIYIVNNPPERVQPVVQPVAQSTSVKNIATSSFVNFEKNNLISEVPFFSRETINATQMFLNNDDDSILHVFDTTGDGSCGIHALLGTYNEELNAFHLKNVTKKRISISNSLKRAFQANNIPKYFEKAMIDYIKYPLRAPNQILDVLNQPEVIESACLIQELLHNRETTDLANICARELINNPLIQEAYLKHLRDRSSYLSSDELGAIAIASGKNLRVYQGDKNVSAAGEADYYHAGNNCETIEIYLDEAQHFERACKKSINENLPELPQNISRPVIKQDVAGAKGSTATKLANPSNPKTSKTALKVETVKQIVSPQIVAPKTSVLTTGPKAPVYARPPKRATPAVVTKAKPKPANPAVVTKAKPKPATPAVASRATPNSKKHNSTTSEQSDYDLAFRLQVEEFNNFRLRQEMLNSMVYDLMFR